MGHDISSIAFSCTHWGVCFLRNCALLRRVRARGSQDSFVMLRTTALLICLASFYVHEARARGIDFGETKTRFQELQTRSSSGRAQSDLDWRRAMASQPRRAARHPNNKR